MVTIFMKYSAGAEGGSVSEIYGLSTDTKPTNVHNASIFYEMDTKKMYLFDKENTSWLEQ